jgi:[ribosomal protein S5]-alanine N-acetyltransferase
LQDEAIYQWISAVPPQSVDTFAEICSKRECCLSPQGDDAWLNWVVRRADDGAYIGTLDAVVDANDIATNVGYLFFPKYWGKGYASEAVKALADHLESSGVLKMIATVTLGNVSSYRVLEKAGFVKTRIIPDNDLIRGKKYDDVEYVRTSKKIAL